MYGNAVVILIVISLVACVLGIVFAAMYFLDRDIGSRDGTEGDARQGVTGEGARVHELGRKPPGEERGANVAQLRSEAR
jgi:hypothetical protein